MKKHRNPWYKKKQLKHVTGFLSEAGKKKLKALAEAEDHSLTRYVSLLLEDHIRRREKDHKA